MARTELTCDTLGDLDEGRARAIINAALVPLMEDLDDRGKDEKTRTLDIKLTFQMKKGNLGVDVQAAAKLPAYRSNQTVAKVMQKKGRNGGTRAAVEFQEHDGENPDQATFPQMDRDADD